MSWESSRPQERLWNAIPEANIEMLKAYTRAKQSIAKIIRPIQRRLARDHREEIAAQYQELMVKLAEDRFTLAVLGQFKRGKSSLMNAILGRDLLPTGALPLTSAITALRYGPVERLIVVREGAVFPEELPVSRLAEYVTEQGNPGNAKRVKTARLEIPSDLLRQGLEFADTPGVGSSIEANTATTLQFLPQCDAVIFVTSVDSPLSKAELDFLGSIKNCVQKIFFVINKMDLLGGNERETVVRYVAESLARLFGPHRINLFPLSARQGLQAKAGGDFDEYEASGLRPLEQRLAEFLAKEKAAAFLVSVVEKCLALLPEPCAFENQDEQGDDFFEKMRSRLQGMKTRLEQPLSEPDSIAAGDLEQEQPAADNAASAIAAELEEQSSAEEMNLGALGCPVCDKLADLMFDFFSKWQYALASEEPAQAAFAAHGGFCPLHTWQLVSLASPQGLSVGLPLLMDRLAGKMSELAIRQAEGNAAALPDHVVRCDACRFLGSHEKDAIAQLAGFLMSEEGLARYRRSQGVCLPHLRQLAAAIESAPLRAELLAAAAKRFGEWAEDMQNYAIKHDAIRRGLVNRNEENAYFRAATHLAGASALCLPAQEDVEI
ncbi:MAG: Bacterial dynamin-like protein [candidate division BRC1 bacterium ADurb.BinA364]|nr:MAG: Bacterial dynamin-like protein [candidate division BRC1 bacterium ADurb.BinA364]